jgi:uncharacterized protein (DUF927 family)
LMSKISRTIRGREEVARNVRKGCRTLDMMMISFYCAVSEVLLGLAVLHVTMNSSSIYTRLLTLISGTISTF